MFLNILYRMTERQITSNTHLAELWGPSNILKLNEDPTNAS
jgi:hypothetical protein